MNSINSFIGNVSSSRKRTGILYCSGLFSPIIQHFKEEVPGIHFIDCAELYKGTLTHSASELLNYIEQSSKGKPSIIANIETFIVSNSRLYSEQLASLLIVREPFKPLFFLFYSKKIFLQFKYEYELKEINQQNILEL